MKKLSFLLFVSLFFAQAGKAQIEGAYISTKDYKAFGFGGFLNLSIPVSEGNALNLEAGVYTFSKDEDNVILIPLLAGYRMTLDGTGTGFYVEPTAGFTIGATDIQKNEYDPVTGTYAEQKAKGLTAGIGTGYILSGSTPVNFGLWYKRVFVTGDPSLNVFALRISYPLSFGRRD